VDFARNPKGMGNKAKVEGGRTNKPITRDSTNKVDKDKAEELRNNGQTHARHDTQKKRRFSTPS
jgi:hypothetical protein